MSDIWRAIAVVGGILTLLAVAPSYLGIADIIGSASMETANTEMLAQVIHLLGGAMVALVPLTLGGMLVFMFFQFAEGLA